MAGVVGCHSGKGAVGCHGGKGMQACASITYYKFRRCSDSVLVDIGMTLATVTDMSLTSANSIKYGGTCYYLNSSLTTTTPGTILTSDDVTKYDCCIKCNGGVSCCGNCSGKSTITVQLSDMVTCGCGSHLPLGDLSYAVGSFNGLYTLTLYGNDYNNNCVYRLYEASPVEYRYANDINCTTWYSYDNNIEILVTLSRSICQVIVYLVSNGISKKVFDGSISRDSCDDAVVSNSITSCNYGGLSYSAYGGTADVI